jgi:hypothetical protein
VARRKIKVCFKVKDHKLLRISPSTFEGDITKEIYNEDEDSRFI